MLKLSLIVPVYNVEGYLRKCVDSLFAQDMPSDEYEVILVDDGSTDSSGAIADSYSDRARVIHQANGGLSSARNAGLDAAEGEYVQFIDSDDYLEPDVLGTLLKKAEGLDVLRINYRHVNEKGEVIVPYKDYKPFVDYSPEVCDGLTFLTERLGYGCYAVQFIVRRELLTDCRFKTGIYFEDVEWTPRMLLKAGKAASSDLVEYNYLIREGSITRASDKVRMTKNLNDRIELMACLDSLSGQVADGRWFKGMMARTAVSVLDSIALDFYPERRAYLKRIAGYLPLEDYHPSRSSAMKMKLANVLHAPLYCCLFHLKAS